MLTWIKTLWSIPRRRRLSIIFGSMIVVGLIFVTVGILASIKVTPYRVYTNTEVGVEIKFPAYWEPVLEPIDGALVVFVSPKQNDLDAIQENLNISIKVLPRPMTLQKLSDMIIEQVTGTFGDQMRILQALPERVGGKPGYRMTFAGSDEKIAHPILYTTAWTIIGDRVYILTFTGLEKDYPLYEKMVNEMIRSFKFIPIV